MKKFFGFIFKSLLVLILLICAYSYGKSEGVQTARKANRAESTRTVSTPKPTEAPRSVKSEPVQEETEGEVEEPEEEPEEEPATGLRTEFKAAMDSYEEFYDEYIDFMKRYQANPTDARLLLQYAEMIVKLEEMDRKFAAWEDEELTNEELKYYMDVNLRIQQKLIDLY